MLEIAGEEGREGKKEVMFVGPSSLSLITTEGGEKEGRGKIQAHYLGSGSRSKYRGGREPMSLHLFSLREGTIVVDRGREIPSRGYGVLGKRKKNPERSREGGGGR